MSLVAKNSNTDFEMTPEGTYIGRCFKVIDLGTQTSTGMFGTKSQHKVMISWELLDDSIKMADGRPFAITQWYTVSLHEKAQLRKDLEAWRGRRFTDEELEGFDLKNVLGTYCMIQIVHSPDGKYANVNAIMSYRGVKPSAVNKDVLFDIDHPDMQIFNSLSENMQEKIKAAPEWGAARQQSADDLEDPFEKRDREAAEALAEAEAATNTDPEMPADFLLPDAEPTEPNEPKGKK